MPIPLVDSTAHAHTIDPWTQIPQRAKNRADVALTHISAMSGTKRKAPEEIVPDDKCTHEELLARVAALRACGSFCGAREFLRVVPWLDIDSFGRVAQHKAHRSAKRQRSVLSRKIQS
jgi:hypothetical protein